MFLCRERSFRTFVPQSSGEGCKIGVHGRGAIYGAQAKLGCQKMSQNLTFWFGRAPGARIPPGLLCSHVEILKNFSVRYVGTKRYKGMNVILG